MMAEYLITDGHCATTDDRKPMTECFLILRGDQSSVI
jgi:hypothetical protein